MPVSWWALYRTRFGLRLRAVGENPASVDTAGISVVRLRYTAVAITGVLCGLAGAYMAAGLQAGFGREMTAGRGYIALAALIFAKWRPWYALWATLLFGFLQALALRGDVIKAAIGFDRSGAGPRCAALHPDRGGAGRCRRPGDPAARRRRALCQGTLKGEARRNPAAMPQRRTILPPDGLTATIEARITEPARILLPRAATP